MEYGFTETKYFKYLTQNSDLLEKQRLEFNDKIISLLKSQSDELGLVLKCHLIIEHYIDELFNVAYPTIKVWKKARLNFSQKLELINTPHTIMETAYTSLKSLNTLRNKFSHKIAYVIKDEDYSEIKEFVSAWYKAGGYAIPEGPRIIENYTLLICANIDTMINGIRNESPELGLPGYLEWLDKMNDKI